MKTHFPAIFWAFQKTPLGPYKLHAKGNNGRMLIRDISSRDKDVVHFSYYTLRQRIIILSEKVTSKRNICGLTL